MKRFVFSILLVLMALSLVGAAPQSNGDQVNSALILSTEMSSACCTLTVPAGAFRPRCHSIEYDTNGVRLTTIADGSSPGCGIAIYHAPVYLPQGVRIKSLTLRAFDNSGGDIGRQVRLQLVRTLDNAYSVLADVGTGGPNTPGNTVETVGANHVVDTHYGYYLDLEMRRAGEGGINDLMFYQAQIEYGYETFLSSILR